LGTWSGTQAVTFTSSLAGSTPVTSNGELVTETFSENLTTGEVELSSCRMAGTPDGEKLRIKAMMAPCRVVSGDCVTDLSVTGGTATVRGDSMTLDYAGSSERDCSGVLSRGLLSAHANLTRK
jgi:hypothetical protein